MNILVDLTMMKHVSVRTWVQLLTDRFQDAIEADIQMFLYEESYGNH